MPRIVVRELGGSVPYAEALEEQRRLARAKIRGDETTDWLLLLEHRPVVTLGRGARDGRHLVASPELLARQGVDLVEIERGGDVTYHGPGQLVGYPILDLGRWRRDLHWYVRTLEAALISALDRLGLAAFRVQGYTGVWVGDSPLPGDSPGPGDSPAPGDSPRLCLSAERAAPLVAAGAVRKVASIGVHVSRWVTWHGFALNVTREPLSAFRLIVPCGIPGVRMTSLETEGAAVERAVLHRAVLAGFGSAFEAELLPEADGADPPGRTHATSAGRAI